MPGRAKGRRTVADVVVARLNLQGALQVHFAQLQIRPCGVGVRAPVEPAHVGVVQLQRSSTHLHRLLVLFFWAASTLPQSSINTAKRPRGGEKTKRQGHLDADGLRPDV